MMPPLITVGSRPPASSMAATMMSEVRPMPSQTAGTAMATSDHFGSPSQATGSTPNPLSAQLSSPPE